MESSKVENRRASKETGKREFRKEDKKLSKKERRSSGGPNCIQWMEDQSSGWSAKSQ
jgi:hypothetical protein